DYAHTPDALRNVLNLARSVCDRRVICVFGCGGDRDTSKRPEMARIGVTNSDIAIITSDNPRTEDPEKIIKDMTAGITDDIRNRSWEVITNRRSAIARALDIADSGDLVLLAGKGHEDYQVLGTEKFPFNEELIVKEIICSG
ncbi:MAG: cyanophycin synthetase, partial [Acidobacteriota bacterium]